MSYGLAGARPMNRQNTSYEQNVANPFNQESFGQLTGDRAQGEWMANLRDLTRSMAAPQMDMQNAQLQSQEKIAGLAAGAQNRFMPGGGMAWKGGGGQTIPTPGGGSISGAFNPFATMGGSRGFGTGGAR